jgi:hypothetical protein
VFIGGIGAALLLIPFVAWGAWTHPHRAFSWGMYSQSSKGFLWTDTGDITRVPSHGELQLDPASHFLTLPTLKRLLSETHPMIPLEGLIIGSAKSCRIRYDPDRRRLATTPLAPGTELTALHAELRRLMSRQPSR